MFYIKFTIAGTPVQELMNKHAGWDALMQLHAPTFMQKQFKHLIKFFNRTQRSPPVIKLSVILCSIGYSFQTFYKHAFQ